MKCKSIKQSDLIPDCWLIQIWGIGACNDCEVIHTEECGGQNIRKLIKEEEYPSTGLPDQSRIC